jgi:hypothetical protein
MRPVLLGGCSLATRTRPVRGRLFCKVRRHRSATLQASPSLNRESGTRWRRRTVWAGTGQHRAAHGSLPAVRHGLLLALFYQRLRAAGKAPTVALTACRRNLAHDPLHDAQASDPLDPGRGSARLTRRGQRDLIAPAWCRGYDRLLDRVFTLSAASRRPAKSPRKHGRR